MMPRSLTARLLLTATVLIGLALTGAGLFTRTMLDHFLHRQIDQQLDNRIAGLSKSLHETPGGLVLIAEQDRAPFDRPGSGWYWQVSGLAKTYSSASLAGRVLQVPAPSAAGVAPPPPLPPPPLADGAPPPPPPLAADARDQGQDLHFRLRTVARGGKSITLLATAPQSAMAGPLAEAMRPVWTALLFAAAALVLATILQVRIGLKPLTALREGVARIRDGRAARLPDGQPSEIAPLASEINILVAENAEALTRARLHMANLAHGLKTPLAALSLSVSGGKPDPREMAAQLHVLQNRIRHHLARARAGALSQAGRSRTPLKPRLDDIRAALEKIYADKALICEIFLPDSLTLACEAQDMDEIFGNLLDNAFKWARTRISVMGRTEGRYAWIAIADDGPGIPADQLGLLRKPGQRLDENVPGDGFGLAITFELAELYGGGLTLGPSDLGGVKAELRLPLRA